MCSRELILKQNEIWQYVFHHFHQRFFLVGFGLLGAGLYSLFKTKIALSWPEASGSLKSCELVEDSSGESTTWRVRVAYDYSVDGHGYSGDRVAFGYSGSSTREEHEAIYEKLNKAATVRVRYNPSKPEESVLGAGVNRSNLILLVFAIVWLSFTTGFTVLWTMASGKDSKLTNSIQVIELKK